MKFAHKFILVGLCILLVLTGVVPAFASQGKNIPVTLNAIRIVVNRIPVHSPNILWEGTTYVPLRAISEMLNMEVIWHQETNTAEINSQGSNSRSSETANSGTGEQGSRTISVMLNTIRIVVDGKPVNAPNLLWNGTTYVPLRAISEMLKKEVLWHQAISTAEILDPGEKPLYPSGEIFGNLPGNIDNKGFVVQAGDWVFYRTAINFNKRSTTGKFYKMKADGSSASLFNNDLPSSLNVLGDWLIYRNDRDGKLYKVKTDGTQRQQIGKDSVEHVLVVNDWIYYANGSDGRKLYKIKLDGTGRKKLVDDALFTPNNSIVYFTINEGWIYYVNRSDGSKIYKVQTDGSGRAQINYNASQSINVIGDKIYYIHASGLLSIPGHEDKDYILMTPGRITQITTTDGAHPKQINKHYTYQLIVDGDWFYYIASSDGYKLYRTKIDGSEEAVLFDKETYHWSLIGDWMYFFTATMDQMYRMKRDGTQLMALPN